MNKSFNLFHIDHLCCSLALFFCVVLSCYFVMLLVLLLVHCIVGITISLSYS